MLRLRRNGPRLPAGWPVVHCRTGHGTATETAGASVADGEQGASGGDPAGRSASAIRVSLQQGAREGPVGFPVQGPAQTGRDLGRQVGKGGLEARAGIDHERVARREAGCQLAVEASEGLRHEKDRAARPQGIEVPLADGTGELQLEPKGRRGGQAARRLGIGAEIIPIEPISEGEEDGVGLDRA